MDYTPIIISVISGIVSLSAATISIIFANKRYEDEKKEKERTYGLSILLNAFQDENNDKTSRLKAWDEYKRMAGIITMTGKTGYGTYLSNLSRETCFLQTS